MAGWETARTLVVQHERVRVVGERYERQGGLGGPGSEKSVKVMNT